MTRRSIGLAWGAAAVVAIAFFAVIGQSAAQQGYTPPRTADGHPDLQGIWQAQNSAWGDLEDHNARLTVPGVKNRPYPVPLGIPGGASVVDDGAIPYLPAAATKKKANFANRLTADPLSKCYMPGIPRATYLPMPFQIFQTPQFIAMTYEFAHTYRVVYTNGTSHVKEIDFWMGDSRGHWEGDTLVIDVTNMNDQTWFDMAGNFHSAALHVVERYTRTDANTMQYEATMDDPKTFSKPWKISMLLYRAREKNARIFEYECHNLAEEAAGTFYVGNHTK